MTSQDINNAFNTATGGCTCPIDDVHGVGNPAAAGHGLRALWIAVGVGAAYAWDSLFGGSRISPGHVQHGVERVADVITERQQELEQHRVLSETFPGPEFRHQLHPGNISHYPPIWPARTTSWDASLSLPDLPGTSIKPPGALSAWLAAIFADLTAQRSYVADCFRWMATGRPENLANAYNRQWAREQTAQAIENLMSMAAVAASFANWRLAQLTSHVPPIMVSLNDVPAGEQRASANALASAVIAEAVLIGKILGAVETTAVTYPGDLAALTITAHWAEAPVAALRASAEDIAAQAKQIADATTTWYEELAKSLGALTGAALLITAIGVAFVVTRTGSKA